jgi:hypothetical protein
VLRADATCWINHCGLSRSPVLGIRALLAAAALPCVSIRALGKAVMGEAEGRKGPTAAHSGRRVPRPIRG